MLFRQPAGLQARQKGLLVELGAEVSEREGSRACVRLFGERRVFHDPAAQVQQALAAVPPDDVRTEAKVQSSKPEGETQEAG